MKSITSEIRVDRVVAFLSGMPSKNQIQIALKGNYLEEVLSMDEARVLRDLLDRAMEEVSNNNEKGGKQ